MKKYKILIVEDEDPIRLGLKDNFELENYEVHDVADGEAAITRAEKISPDIVILDVMIPRKNGFEVCRHLRKKHPEIYIILLTAKVEESSKVAGLEMGADDYVTKPFSILELIARVKSYIRRLESSQNKSEVDEVEFADIWISFKKYQAKKGKTELDLNNREYQILKFFWEHRGEVVLREDLLESVWGYQPDNMPTTRTVDNQIVKLRSKIENNPSEPSIILSVRGAGYKLNI